MARADSAPGRGLPRPAVSPVLTCPQPVRPGHPEHNQRGNGHRPSIRGPVSVPGPGRASLRGPESLPPLRGLGFSMCPARGSRPERRLPTSCSGRTSSGPTSAVRPGVTTRWCLGLAAPSREGRRRAAVTWRCPASSPLGGGQGAVGVGCAPLQEEGPCALTTSPGWAQCSRTGGEGHLVSRGTRDVAPSTRLGGPPPPPLLIHALDSCWVGVRPCVSPHSPLHYLCLSEPRFPHL